ncbi:hypothetical protein [Listonella phage phiHSIC]|uniref:hypothetical protein n=1 Tax=Listonella phage phiHSIC TaxID=310539 RepID=UPI00004C741D|nr:hypothetical protein LPPPVgp33 [Listonella phage phiHSIC]AAW67533.1 hypothetical protein [Listonella phage phiHSIC]
MISLFFTMASLVALVNTSFTDTVTGSITSQIAGDLAQLLSDVRITTVNNVLINTLQFFMRAHPLF